MKNKLCKRLLVSAMACSLLLSGVGGMNSVYAEETTSEQDSGYDVDKPVIESISIDKQGQTISKDTPVKISVKAYDLGSGIKKVQIAIGSDANETTLRVEGTYNNDTGCYEYTIPSANVSGYTFNGKTYIANVMVQDMYDHTTYGVVASQNGLIGENALYWFNYATEDLVKPTIDAIEITPSNGRVAVGNTVGIFIKVSDNVAIDKKRAPYVNLACEVSQVSDQMIALSWNESKQGFVGEFKITNTTYPGKWSVKWIQNLCDTSGNKAEISADLLEKACFIVENDDADTEGPIIKNVSMTRVGESITSGDTIKVSVDATDDVGIASGTATLCLASSSAQDFDITSSVKSVSLNKNEETGQYEGTFKVDNTWYATEWYLSMVSVSDTMGNTTRVRGFDGNTYVDTTSNSLSQGYSLEEKYYVNVHQDNNFVLPEYTVSFSYTLEDGSSEVQTAEFARRTPLNSILQYAQTLDIPEIAGVKLIKWNQWAVANPEVTTSLLNPAYFQAHYDKKFVDFILYQSDKDPVGYLSYDDYTFLTRKTAWVKAGDTIKVPSFEGYKNLQWYNAEMSRNGVYIGDLAGTTEVTLPQNAGDGGDYDSWSFYAKVTDANISTDNKDNTGDNNNTGNNGNTNGNNGSSDNSNNSGNTNNSGNNNNTNNSGSNGNGSDGAITPVKPAVTLPETKIAETVTEIKSAKTGVTIKVDMDDATVVPKEILKQAQGKDVNVVLEMNGYTWTVNGKNIAASDLQDINLEVTRNTNYIPNGIVSAIAGNNPVEQISLTYNGNFGFKAELTINVGKQYYGKYGNLYYYDSDGKMVLMNAGAIDKDGNVTLGFSHASEYAIVITDVPASQNQSDGQAQTGQNLSSPKTGDTSVNYLYIMMVLAGTAMFAMLVYGLMKDRTSAK